MLCCMTAVGAFAEASVTKKKKKKVIAALLEGDSVRVVRLVIEVG